MISCVACDSRVIDIMVIKKTGQNQHEGVAHVFTESGYKVHLMPPSTSLNNITRLHSFKTTNELSPRGLSLISSTVVSATERLSETPQANGKFHFKTLI